MVLSTRPSNRHFTRRFRRLRLMAFLLACAAVLVLVCLFTRGGDDEAPPGRVLTLYAYSGLDEVLTDGLVEAFEQRWEERTGGRVKIERKFGGSCDLVTEILAGARPQIVILSSEMDANRLVPDVVRPEAWKTLPHGGVFARSPLILHVREGNPKGVKDFESLVSSDAIVIRPAPRTCGLGAYGLLAAYGEEWSRTGSRQEALGLAFRLQISSLCPAVSARAAARCFRNGIGDVCVAYEHDVLATPLRPRKPGEIVRPPNTLLCEPIVVVLRRNATPDLQAVLDVLVGFLWSPEARTILEAYGLHAPDADGASLGLPGALTLKDLGGSERAAREILEPFSKNLPKR